MEITVYITFNGNCREAMNFYKYCLGGELTFQTVGESPLSEKMPLRMKACILQAMLIKGSLLLMGTDMVNEQGLIKGNAVTIMLRCASEQEIRQVYKKLVTGGVTQYPLEYTIQGALFGGLTDKYGHHWLLHYDKKQSSLLFHNN
jgi:PhnB protein